MIIGLPQLKLLWPNPSLNTDVPRAGATPRAAGRRLAPFR
jgi:hypothetical protein